MMHPLKLEDFTPYVGQNLKAEIHDRMLEIELSEAMHSNLSTSSGFNLLFRYPENTQCQQGNYQLHIKHISQPVTVFMTPVLSDKSCNYLEALFN